jgi:hypothetical protein
MRQKKNTNKPSSISRRDFLRAAAIGAAAASFAPLAGSPFGRRAEAAAPGEQNASPMVVDVRSPKWRVNGQVDAAFVLKMIDVGMARLTGKKTRAEAWRLIAGPDQVVGVKFNDLSGNYTNANQALVDAITASLIEAGVKKENIIVAEAVGATWQNAKNPDGELGEPLDIGGGRQARLTRFLTQQVDVLINVPNIKDHGGAGITGCLKNISHSRTIGRPPIHDDSCCPGIIGINKLEPIPTKRRLNIVNGLEGVFDGGPGHDDPNRRWPHNGLLFSTDPVASDRVQLEIIEAERKRQGRPSLFERGCKPVHVERAAQAGLGVADLAKINWVKAYDES